MGFSIEPTEIPEVRIVAPAVFEDPRGFFMETYHEQRYREGGVAPRFVQDNHSRSRRGTLRGLHYQYPCAQGKLVFVPRGDIFDVAVDIRVGSPTFKRWVARRLSDANRLQMYIPEGFAHGFCVLSDTADVVYKCTNLYDAAADRGILWSDPDLAIEWPVSEPLLSAKDGRLPRLRDVDTGRLPPYATTRPE